MGLSLSLNCQKVQTYKNIRVSRGGGGVPHSEKDDTTGKSMFSKRNWSSVILLIEETPQFEVRYTSIRLKRFVFENVRWSAKSFLGDDE